MDVSEILAKAEINLLGKNDRSAAFVVQNNIRDMQAQKVFATFKNIVLVVWHLCTCYLLHLYI